MEPNLDILRFADELCVCIDKLNGINTKVDFTEDYDNGYNDACVAIKNTANTLVGKWCGNGKKEN